MTEANEPAAPSYGVYAALLLTSCLTTTENNKKCTSLLHSFVFVMAKAAPTKAPAKKAPAAAKKAAAASPKAAPAKKTPAKAPAKAAAKKAAKSPPKAKAPAKQAPPKQAAKKTPSTATSAATKKAAAPAVKVAPPASKAKKSAVTAVASAPVLPAGKVKQTATVPSTTKILQKGRGVVDQYCPNAAELHVVEKNNCVYQCTLNQTNMGANNNKFYVIQLVEGDTRNEVALFTRWGRVGVTGQTMVERMANVDTGILAFEKKFMDKTGNRWLNRANFEKKAGKYYLMDIEYAAGDDEEEEGKKSKTAKKAGSEPPKPPPIPPSTLPTELQDIMKIISNRDYMLSVMKELEVDTKRLPLGKISKPQIMKAYEYLKQIEAELKKPNPQLEGPSELFYTLIPHDFGFRRPPLINSPQLLKAKVKMLETLGELEIASKMMEIEIVTKNPLDTTYESLHCDLTPLDHDSEEFQRIEEFTRNSKGKTHGMKLTVESVFRINRDAENERDKVIKKVGNRHMLWHGSRATNFIGILSQGLRIAPKEAPCTGYMFGKGIYLADCCSKSANYCNAYATNKTGLMLLCEAALGKPKELRQSQYMEEPLPGSNSTKGCGCMVPDPKGAKTIDGVVWPMGKILDAERSAASLYYNEYIVYDVSQVKMKYLIKMKFD
eukprot:gene6698-4796_t